MKLLNIIVVLALIAPAALAQPSPALAQSRQPSSTQGTSGTPDTPGTRTLRGVVVTANDTPLPRVRIAVAGAPASELPVLTDERGRFSVRIPDAQSVRLTFTKARYASATVDVRSSDASGGNVSDLRVRLSLGGAINGRVRDRFGNPVHSATMTARRLDASAASDPIVATTNDLGEFRFGGLPNGAYAVGVRRVQSGAEWNMPGATEEQTVTVGVGAEVSGIDVTLDLPSELDRYPRTFRIEPSPQATASLQGRVLDARGAPIARALVQARGPNGLTQAVESDARGRYVLDHLDPGDYMLEAVKRGFIPLTPGQSQSSIELLVLNTSPVQQRSIPVRRGQTVDSLDLVLTRGASISGTIVDEFGEPMQGVAVTAFELRAMGGLIRAFEVSSARAGSGATDDRGRYRLHGLQPGTYVIRAAAGAILSPANGYAPLFYPGTAVIDLATPTTLDADGSAAGVDLALAPQPARRVQGTLVDPAGNPATVSQVSLTPRSLPNAIQMEPLRARVRDGTFVFNNVASGEYVIQASGPGFDGSGVGMAIARALVTVSGDEPPPVQLKLAMGATLTGRVVYEGIANRPPRYDGVSLTAIPADVERDPIQAGGPIGFVLRSDDTFEYRGVFGRSFLATRVFDANWYVKSIMYKGQELADTAFDYGDSETFSDIEIVVSGAGAMVAGHATDDRAAPVLDYSVAIFPTDRSKWTVGSRWLKSRPSSQDGAFRVIGLVPGEYWAVAVDRLAGSDVAGDLQNPDVLDALATRATRITLNEGQIQDLTLRLVRR